MGRPGIGVPPTREDRRRPVRPPGNQDKRSVQDG